MPESEVLGVDPIQDYWETAPEAFPFLAVVLPADGHYRLDPAYSRLSTARPTGSDEFDPRLVWWRYIPQAGGVCCNHPGPYYVAPLQPTDVARSAIAEIETTWLGSNVGCPQTAFDDVVRYREQIRRLLGADCRWSYKHFQEAVYPLDWDEGVINRLCSRPAPPFDKLIVGRKPFGADRWFDLAYDPQSAFSEFLLIVFGNNSD